MHSCPDCQVQCEKNTEKLLARTSVCDTKIHGECLGGINLYSMDYHSHTRHGRGLSPSIEDAAPYSKRACVKIGDGIMAAGIGLDAGETYFCIIFSAINVVICKRRLAGILNAVAVQIMELEALDRGCIASACKRQACQSQRKNTQEKNRCFPISRAARVHFFV